MYSVYGLDATEFRPDLLAATLLGMAKQKKTGSEPYTDPITVRFDKALFADLSAIRVAAQQMTGAKMPMSKMIAAAVREYVEKRRELIGQPATQRQEAKPRRKKE